MTEPRPVRGFSFVHSMPLQEAASAAMLLLLVSSSEEHRG